MKCTHNRTIVMYVGICIFTTSLILLISGYIDNARIKTKFIAKLAETKSTNFLRPYTRSRLTEEEMTHSSENNLTTRHRSTNTDHIYSIMWHTKPIWASKDIITYKFRNCAFKNCIIREPSRDNLTCDALLFHHEEMNIKVPNKIPGLIWVFMSYESEAHTLKHFLKKEWDNKFDWVFSYRSDADISFPYGVLHRRNIQNDKNYTSLFQKKSKSVAWVVSNCKSDSHRYKYIKKMMQSIQIDVYGKCGKTCSSSWNSDKCFNDLSKDYKFYLAFENSICKDYVSEKVFRLYQDGFDFIPVYRGAMNIKDILPNGTFISSFDFSSALELALYLKNVGSNESAYTNYLKAKDKFFSNGYTRQEVLQFMYCSVCEKLNNKYERSPKLNLTKWMLEKKCIIPTDV